MSPFNSFSEGTTVFVYFKAVWQQATQRDHDAIKTALPHGDNALLNRVVVCREPVAN